LSEGLVLITGVSGFAGRHLAELVTRNSDHVVGVSRSGTPVDGVDCRQLDLTDAAATDRLIDEVAPAKVFHLAAESSVARSWNNRIGVVRHNLESTLNLLEAILRHSRDSRVLVTCSGEEYGPPELLPVDEGHPLRPQNPYAMSKAALDMAAGFYADAYGLQVTRMRAFNHAGPGQSETYVASDFAKQIAHGEASEGEGGLLEVVTGNTDVRRDFTDVRDVVRAYWLALDCAEPGVYNVCSGRSVAVADILAGLAAHTTLEVRARTDPERLRPREVMEIQGSHEKLTYATGWKPEIPLDRTLGDMLDWWRARHRAEVAS
jgi:GDP-4-dehydro-6-deoxy-D-mannose reductase